MILEFSVFFIIKALSFYSDHHRVMGYRAGVTMILEVDVARVNHTDCKAGRPHTMPFSADSACGKSLKMETPRERSAAQCSARFCGMPVDLAISYHAS